MENLKIITLCDDGSCCCLPPRSTIALISIMSLLASAIDMMSTESCSLSCPMKNYVESMRSVLLGMFQIANLLLLVASVIENALLVNIYVCYTLGFVVMGLGVSILELMYRIVHDGALGIVYFVPEVVFIFVISRCLPLVNSYKRHLDHLTATLSALNSDELDRKPDELKDRPQVGITYYAVNALWDKSTPFRLNE